jgi:NTP pyrophosphatase (non-canonical NTP hydrolase)
MTANEYQREALVTWKKTPIHGFGWLYPALGAAGEVGELVNKVKKLFRDDGGTLTWGREKAMVEEMGDVLWYIAVMAHELGFTLEEVMRRNIEKLRSRQERGTIHGDGDNR